MSTLFYTLRENILNYFLKSECIVLCCVYKNVSNIEVCDFNPAPVRTLSIKHIIVVLYLNLVLPHSGFYQLLYFWHLQGE